MLHAPRTRASGRAAAIARAHADVTARQPIALGVALSAILAVGIAAGTASMAPAAEAAEVDAPTIASLADSAQNGSDPAAPAAGSSQTAWKSAITKDAVGTLKDAQDAVSDARDVAADVAAAGLPLDTKGVTAVDTTELATRITTLGKMKDEAGLRIVVGTSAVATETEETIAETTYLRAALVTAMDQKAEADRAAAAAAAAKKAEEERAAALAAANSPEGAKATARQMAESDYGWGEGEFSCLASLWTKESGWNYQAYNEDGGATGIPQALPGSKMASAGSDWRTSAATQISWGLGYIQRTYGSPCAAWGHSQAMNWY